MGIILLVSAVMMNITASPSRIDLDLDVPTINVSQINSENGIFDRITIHNEGFLSNIGKPKLPVVRRFIEIPWGARVVISGRVLESKVQTLTNRVVPVQPPRPKTPNYQGPFTIDHAAYNVDLNYPLDLVRIVDDVVMRGHRVLIIEVSPVQYNPIKSQLVFNRKIKVTIGLSGSDLGLTDQMVKRFYSRAFEPVFRNLIVNYNEYSFSPPPDLPIGYLIITPDAWVNYLDPLVEWRKKKGYHVTVATKSQTGSSASQIKSYIQNAYNDWPIPPSFVLLIGDIDQIPNWTGSGSGSPPTDLNYSCVDGSDYFPDVDLSRFSIANTTQLDSLVKKVVKYERNDWTTPTDWLDRTYWIASADGGNHQIAEATHKYCMAIVRSYGMSADSLWLYYGTGTPVTTAINGGRSWATYSGHGSTTSWAEVPFSVSNVHSLTNTDKVPFVQTYACLAGDFTYGECFSESWIRVGYRGAISHIASSVTSYWDEDDILQRRVFDAAFDTAYYWIMGMCNKGKYELYRYYGNTPTVRRYFEMYNLMGDGSIDVYGDVPHMLIVNHPSIIPVGNYNLDVTVNDDRAPVEDALVGVRPALDDTVFAGYTDVSGQATIPIYTSQPETVYITVTGHSLEPYEGYCLAQTGGVEEEPYQTNFRLVSSTPTKSIKIGYSLARPCKVEISLYDCIGKKVVDVYTGFKTVGNHDLKITTKYLGTGVYFLKFKAGEFTRTEKIILLK